ncbi:MAG: carbohydrate ABC transporter permease [Anaerolineales bacterium]
MKVEKTVDSSSQSEQFIKWPSILLGILIIMIGIGAILWLIISINSNQAIQTAVNGLPTDDCETPSLVMAFLIEFGFILPILVLIAGFGLIWFGIKLFSGNIAIGRWAQVIFLWLTIGATILLLFNVYNLITAKSDTESLGVPVISHNKIYLLGGLLLIILFFGGCSFWIKRNSQRFFRGQEELSSSEVRFAWNLLIPTLIVLVFVAGRPLEQTFIRSLTDKRFAGQNIPNYIGLENYHNLLGIRFDVVTCRLDEDTGNCALNPNGSLQWETIDRELLKEGFRSVWTLKIPFTEKTTGLTISGLDRDFIQSIWTTLIFTIISVSLEFIVAMFIALTVNSKFKGRGLMRAVMLVPWAIPTAISAVLWDNMLKSTSSGIINKFLLDLHIIAEPKAWLAIPALQIPSAIMVDVWKTSPFVALLLLAGLQTISEDLYEAASVDGANGIQKFFQITLPLLRPTIAVALVFRTLDALRVFDLFNVLFARQQLTMATYNYEMLVGSQKDGYASAISIIIFILISIFAIIYVRMLNVETE